MPIVKRITLPPVKHRRPSRVEPYQQPGRPLVDILRELDRKVSDYDWAGDNEAEADNLRYQAEAIRERIEAGELYEVDF